VSSDLEAALETAVATALRRTGTPGAALTVTLAGRTVAEGAWGTALRDAEPGGPVPIQLDTIFDVASITKVAATTAVAMAMVQRGELDVDDRVQRHLPEFTVEGAEQVRVRHLLAHDSGLPDWAPLFLTASEPSGGIAAACGVPLRSPPGRQHRYSDLGMVLLGVLLERLGGARLDQLARDMVFAPLEMDQTGFGPLRELDPGRVAATSVGNPVEWRMVVERDPSRSDDDPSDAPWWRERTLVGEVNDANAAVAFGGVAGHAGLFSTAADLTRFADELHCAAQGRDGRVFTSAVVRRFLEPVGGPTQGLGFWLRRVASTVGERPRELDRSFGHRGFTGCELLVEPSRGCTIVLLTNRLHGGDPPPPHEPLWDEVLRRVLDAIPPG
jgi:serine-type D-Ala-D-Ala carboxypeptidase